MTVAISLLTGIEMIHAKSMREILPIVFPGKKIRKMFTGRDCRIDFLSAVRTHWGGKLELSGSQMSSCSRKNEFPYVE